MGKVIVSIDCCGKCEQEEIPDEPSQGLLHGTTYYAGLGFILMENTNEVEVSFNPIRVTLPVAGTYMIFANAVVNFDNAKFLDPATLILKVAESTNGAESGTINNGEVHLLIKPNTSNRNDSLGHISLPVAIITTQEDEKDVSLFAQLVDPPSQGGIIIGNASVTFLKLT